MTEIEFPQVLETVRATSSAYHKLTIIAGGAGSGKTHMLRRVATQLELPMINLNLLLSQRLLNQTRHQRELRAQELATDVIDENIKAGLCLDNIELLFDTTLKTNPLVFLKDISRNRLIVATWNGFLSGGELRYGYPGHPDAFSGSAKGYPVVAVAGEKLELHLTT